MRPAVSSLHGNIANRQSDSPPMGNAMNRPLHIAYAVAAGGGAETYVRQIACALTAQGQTVTVIYLRAPGEITRRPAADGPVRLEYAPVSNMHYYHDRLLSVIPRNLQQAMPGGALVKAAETSVALRNTVQRVQRTMGPIDIMEVAEETAFPAFFRRVVPYAVKLHSSDATWRYYCGEGLRRIDYRRIHLETRLLQEARLVSAPSSAVADHVAAMCNFPRSKIFVLPYPLDVDRFCPADVTEIETHPSVLYVGRMDKRKGLETLARATASILGKVAGATIDIVGAEVGGMSAHSFLAHVPPALHDRVVFHGRVPHDGLPQYYRRASVCVVPSCWDNSPNTVYEAMGCGIPVVASRVGGIPELVSERQTGLLVPPNSPDALGAAVCSLLTDEPWRRKMGHAAAWIAASSFDPARIASQTLAHYQEAMGFKLPKRAPGRSDS
jgi:glycosyltransferase involved in cell wall biosynthesis